MYCVDGRGGPGGLAPPAGGYRGPGPLVLHSTKACALFVVLFVCVSVRLSVLPRASGCYATKDSTQKSVSPDGNARFWMHFWTNDSIDPTDPVESMRRRRTRTAGSHTDPVESVRRRRTRTTCRFALHPLTDSVESVRGRRTHATQVECPGVEPKQQTHRDR